MRAEDWISVKERLPEGTTEVLALCNKSHYVLDFIVNDDKGKFYFGTNWPVRVLEDFTKYVTHWQPLPLPPKDLTTNNLVGSELSIKETV